jgi:hypothetical protein
MGGGSLRDDVGSWEVLVKRVKLNGSLGVRSLPFQTERESSARVGIIVVLRYFDTSRGRGI